MKASLLKLTGFFILISSFSLDAIAGSATWNVNPVDNNWNNPANWTPATVPNGASDTATFGASSGRDVSITMSVEVNSIVFSPGASAFTIAPSPANGAIALTLSGAGVINDSGITQNFVTSGDEDSGSLIIFRGATNTGHNALLTCNPGPSGGGDGIMYFRDNANLSDATLVNNGGYMYFLNESTAAEATIIVNGSDQGAGQVVIGSGQAGNATLIANGGAPA